MERKRPIIRIRTLLSILLVISFLASFMGASTVVSAAAGSYTLKWYAADPEVNRAPYLPTYTKVKPSEMTCPTPSGEDGRAADPMKDAVAYAPPAIPSNLDAVTSLMPKTLALGQVVPFELEIVVSGNTAPENGIINFTPYWLTKVTNGDDFGFDPSYGVYCAFVDTADPGTSDPGNDAKVDSWTSSIVNTGTSNEQIQGTILVSGLNDGDKVIVEIWVVLKSSIAPNVGGNVQTGLVEARTTSSSTGSKINIGNQTVPLLQVSSFYTAQADVSVTKSDSPDPVYHTDPVSGEPKLTYSIVVTNNSTDTVANGIVVNDNLDPNVTFVSGTWLGGNCTAASGVVTCSVGALSPGQSLTITIVNTVNASAPNNDTSVNEETGTCTTAGPGIDLCNKVSISAITADPNTANNSDSEPTNVLVGTGVSAALTLVKTASPTTYNSVGNIISYSFKLTNSGNVPLSGPFTITDDKATDEACPSTPASLAPGDFITCTASYTITQADLNSGSVTNTAAGHGFYGTNAINSNEDSETVTANKAPALTIVKTATPTTYSKVGDVISYSYVVKNTGNITLSNITVTDDKATVSCPDTSTGLAPLGTITCSASYTISQADLDADSVTNTAYAKSGDTQSTPDSETVTANKNPALTLKKSATETTYAAVGDVLHYSYLVTNSGNVTLHDAIVVSDDKATDEACPALPAGGLVPGASITCTATYTVTQADLDAGKVTNVASAASGTTTSNTDTVTVLATQTPSLSLTKTASPSTYTTAGQTISYSYLLRNAGNVTLSAPFAVTDDKATVTCPASVTSLAPGATLACTASYTISQADLDNGSVTNKATATAKFSETTVTSGQATATVTAIQSPALAIDKTAQETTYATAGEVIHYSYLVTNSGNVTLHNPITVIDDKTTATCPALDVAGLKPGVSITCSATYTILQSDLDAGSLTNVAYATSGTTQSPTDTVTITGSPVPHLTLTKTYTTHFSDPVKVGDTIDYTLTATNDDSVTLNNVTITDAKLGTLTCTPAQPATLAPKATLTCTGTYTLTQADIDAGKVDNTATVTSKLPGGGNGPSGQASQDVPITQTPHLSITKSADPATYSKVGDVITYSIVATNDGNVTLNNVTVSDPSVSGLTCTPANGSNLAPGAALTCTATHTVTQADLDAGQVANTACVDDGTGGAAQQCASKDVSGSQAPGIALAKSVQEASFTNAGDVLHYTLVATNTGNVTLSNVSISDPLLGTLTCTPSQPATLTPGATLSCTGSYTTQQSDVNAGHVANTGTATGTFGGKDYTATDSKDVPASTVPHLTLTKAATPHFSDPVKVGDTIDYTLTATNDDSVTLNNVTISDALLPSLTCNPTQPATLGPTQSLVCTGTYALTQADIDAGHVANTAYATSKLPGGGNGPSGQDSKDVPITQNPHMTVTKAGVLDMTVVDPSDRADVGDKINYTITVTNDGNQTLTGVSVTDAKLGALTCTPAQPATLAPTNQMVCTGSYTLTLTDINAGTVHNVAIGTSNEFTPPETPNDVPVPKAPALTLTKVGILDMTVVAPADRADVGDKINYTLTAANVGNETLSNVSISDPLLGTLTCTPSQPATLAPAAILTCTSSYTLTQADIDAGNVHNVAVGQSNQTPPTYTPNDVPIPLAPSIALAKSVQEASFTNAGDVLHYTLVATNTGNVTLTNVSISDPLLDSLTCTPSQPTTLAPAATLTCTGSYTVQQSDVDAGKVDNTATATGSFGGKGYTDTDSKSVPSAAAPHITLTKTATPNFSSPVKVGDTISYKLVATNDDDVTLSNVTISDPLLSSLTCTPAQPATLSPAATLTCTGSYTLTQADIDSGKIDNTATVTSKLPNGTNGPTAQASKDVPITQTPALTLDKTASPMTYSKVGDMIAYSYLVTNSGNVTLFGSITVTDDKATVTCPALDIAGLKPGASITCSASYTITQADLNAGSVTNTAYATSGTIKSNTDSVTVTANTTASISLTKTANPTNYDYVGQTIAYSYVIKNTGNVTVNSPFTVSDNKLTVTCPATPASLNPGDTLTCTGSYTITQADLDAGSVTNKATASNGTVNSNEATATITGTSSPSITLTKTANPATYKVAGDVIGYTLVAKNTGNVTLNNVSISDPVLGTLTCTPSQPATLAPNATLTCTGSYTIQAGDVLANGGGSVKNTATVISKLPSGEDGPTATASATVTQVWVPPQTGVLLPTQTTCQMYASGQWPAMYSAFTYQVKSNKINSISPGVIYYYNTISAPGASFTLNVAQTNSLNWNPMLIQDLGQAILYNADCSKASGVTVTTSGTGTANPYSVKFTVTGATPGAIYYIGIKYTPANLVGQSIKQPYPTNIYYFETVGYIGSKASIPVKPK